MAVYDARTRTVHMLNRVAFVIWQCHTSGVDINGIVTSLMESYPDVSREKITQDVRDTLRDLQNEKLIPDASPYANYGDNNGKQDQPYE